MSTNVGHAALQVIPSLRNLRRHLQREADPVLSRWAKDAGQTISTAIGGAVGDGVRDSVQGAAFDSVRDSVQHSVGDGVREGVREGVRDGAAEPATRPLRTGIRRAVLDGFREGFRGGLDQSRQLGDGLSRSLRLGLRDGVATGVRQGFDTAKDRVRRFFQWVEDEGRSVGPRTIISALSALREAAMSAVKGGLNLLSGVLLSLASALPIVLTGFTLLAPVVALVGGLWGSMFTLATGLVGVVGVLGLATRGLGAAFGELFENGKVSNETLKALAPNARKFVRALEGIRKPLSDLRRAVQNRFFARLDKPFQALAKRWLPALRPMLGDLADRMNRFAREILKALGRPDFLKNVRAAFRGFGDFLDRVTDSMGPFIDSWGILAKASVPFLAELGDRIGGVIDKFNAWMKSAEKSGALKSFMDDAAKALRDIWAIGGLVVKIGGELLDTFFPPSKRASDSFLGGVRDWLQEVRDWLADPKNKQRMRDWMDKLVELVRVLTQDVGPAVRDIVTKVDGWITTVEEWGRRIDGWKTKIGIAFEAVRIVVGAKVAAVGMAIDSLKRPLDSVLAAFRSLRTGAGRQLEMLLGLVRSLPERIRTALGDVGNLLFSAGASIVSGLARGMRENIGKVTGAGSALGRAARVAAEQALKVNSPSKVFMTIGRHTADGMAIGITQGRSRVTQAMQAMVEPPRSAAPTLADRRTVTPTQAAPSAPTTVEYHLHHTRATIAQLQALQARQAILARVGRAR